MSIPENQYILINNINDCENYGKIIDEVFEDYKNKGRTDKICIHFGKPMKYIKSGNSYKVRCETNNCIREVFR